MKLDAIEESKIMNLEFEDLEKNSSIISDFIIIKN